MCNLPMRIRYVCTYRLIEIFSHGPGNHVSVGDGRACLTCWVCQHAGGRFNFVPVPGTKWTSHLHAFISYIQIPHNLCYGPRYTRKWILLPGGWFAGDCRQYRWQRKELLFWERLFREALTPLRSPDDVRYRTQPGCVLFNTAMGKL